MPMRSLSGRVSLQSGGLRKPSGKLLRAESQQEAVSQGRGGKGLVPAGSGEWELEEAPEHEAWPWRCGSLAVCHLPESPSGLT